MGFEVDCDMKAHGAAGIVLAAGHGTRFGSATTKILHRICGRPLVCYALDALHGIGVPVCVVVGHMGDEVSEAIKKDPSLGRLRARFCVQAARRGTAHAVACGVAEFMGLSGIDSSGSIKDILGGGPRSLGLGSILVVYGDSPLISAGTLAALLERHGGSGAAATLLTFRPENPCGYGRVVRDESGFVEKVVEERDAGSAERRIGEVVGPALCFRADTLIGALEELRDDNVQGEFRLTDAISALRRRGLKVGAFEAPSGVECLGVNTPPQMNAARDSIKRRIIDELISRGVTVVDPSSTFVDFGIEIGEETTIHPFSILEGGTKIGRRCSIGPSAHVIESELGDEVRAFHSVIENSVIGNGVSIGPYSHIRPGCAISDRVRIGNFAEVKGSSVGAGTKINHHSYIGDARVGAGVNIGAGTVVVNYDGVSKHPTAIEDSVFVGCNSNLIAPVRLGKGSYVAAGSTIDRDVPQDALSIARSRQENKEGWVTRRRGKVKGGPGK